MMGLGPGELGIILVIVLVIFGGKKLKNLGGDLGGAISEFKTSLKDDTEESDESTPEPAAEKKPEPVAEKTAESVKAAALNESEETE